MPTNLLKNRSSGPAFLVVAGLLLAGCNNANRSSQSPVVQTEPAVVTKPPKGTEEMNAPVAGEPPEKREYNPLTPAEKRVIIGKETERKWAGEYTDLKDSGTFVCRRCNAQLYKSDDKFESECGWPSFDDEIPGSVERVADIDGFRTEIVCKNCGGHLGHVFLGEGLTKKDTRHCVNSISMKFYPAGETPPRVIVKK